MLEASAEHKGASTSGHLIVANTRSSKLPGLDQGGRTASQGDWDPFAVKTTASVIILRRLCLRSWVYIKHDVRCRHEC